jgi:ribosomal protein S18 acetylase RimI-like enzyme
LRPALINRIDGYLDAAPRPEADAVEAGAFTLFVSRTPWSYYARPTVGLDRAVDSADLALLATRCAERGVALKIEWVREVCPELEQVAGAFGLSIHAHDLMVADAGSVAHGDVDGVRLRIAGVDDPGLIDGCAVAEVSFAFGGTQPGAPCTSQRDEVRGRLSSELVAHLLYRADSGLTVTAVAESDPSGIVATGAYQPVEEAAEVVAVATLPCARRRGIAGALTARLATDAAAHGVDTLLLSAQDADVARVYELVGFAKVGVACAAEADRGVAAAVNV